MSRLANARQLVRREGVIATLDHVRISAMRHIHHLWERAFEAREAVATSGFAATTALAPLDATSIAEAREYIPSPRLPVRWLIDGLGENLAHFSFVDFGSGRGRVLMTAAEYPFCAVRGVEFSQVLHAEAERNIAARPRHQQVCRDVASVCMDAARYELPPGDCVLYFFNPFRAGLLARVVANAVATVKARGDRLIILFYNPEHARQILPLAGLRERRLGRALRLKLALASPYQALAFEAGRRDRA